MSGYGEKAADNAVRIREYIDAHRSGIIDDLFGLMRIDSAYSEEGKDEAHPFGSGSARALSAGSALLSGYGFPVKNYDNYVITADLGEGERELDILAHLDVVPGGEGWTVTKPFVPVMTDDGVIYGRGSADDKGPAIAAIYAMRAIKELGIPLRKNVRLVLGGCEEIGLGDLEYYFEREPHARYSFSPDADYPLINAERGISGTEIIKKFSAEAADASPIRSVHAGLRRNMVPFSAVVVIDAEKGGTTVGEVASKAAEVARSHGLGLEIQTEGNIITIDVRGVGGHASSPENSLNSLTCLMEIIASLPFTDEVSRLVRGLSALYPFGVYHGESAGIDMEDDISGRISSSFNVTHYDADKCEYRAVIDSRVPAMACEENFMGPLKKALTAAGADSVEISLNPCHYVPENSEFVQKLLNAYKKVTGDADAKPFAIGGGTYVHNIDNGVAFGCAMPGVDNRMHGPDEFMMLDVLLKSIEIFAEAIISICG
ncbi:MAG: Sapep family Mn(2+)-dependent dipeptidase [Clostridia bacterium]|nr:Sapep family Mn(2+)-dependent dipeptidase [Clostridia bacterium]